MRLMLSAALAGTALLLGGGNPAESAGAAGAEAVLAPEFPSLDPSSWAGPATSLSSSRGRVVLLNVWTFGCINCQRTLPWVQGIAERFAGKGVSVIGVHSPEFDREKNRKKVEEARKRHGLTYPSFIDNGHLYWNALRNRYWPAIYLIDKKGRIRRVQVGEVHEGDAAARSLERAIETLLAEPY